MDGIGSVSSQQMKDAGSSRTTVRRIYILYLIGLLLMFPYLVGVIIAYFNRGRAPDWLKSHYAFQIRTFWIGLLYCITIAYTPGLLLILLLIGFGALTIDELTKELVSSVANLLGYATMVIWNLIRLIKGMVHLSQGRSHPNPNSWLFG